MGVGMLGMVLAGDWKKKRNRRALGIILLVVALAMIMALVGCGWRAVLVAGAVAAEPAVRRLEATRSCLVLRVRGPRRHS